MNAQLLFLSQIAVATVVATLGENWATFYKHTYGRSRLFFVYFRSFQRNINTTLQQINLKKCPFSIRS